MNNEIERNTADIQGEIKSLSQKQAFSQVWEERHALEELLQQHPMKIMVAGNIGFGKTTVTSIIGTFGKIKEINEPVDNPVLQLYYNDMKAYSERLQLDLINVRLTDVVFHCLQNPSRSLAFDRTHYEDTYIFCEVLRKADLMTSDERNFCHWYFDMKLNQLEQRYGMRLIPDLIIFLKGDIETGWKRTVGRERKMEVREDAGKGVGLSKEFYQALHDEYEIFHHRLLEGELYKGPLLTLSQDTVEVADATNSKGQLYVVKSVKEAIKVVYGKA